MFRFYSENDVRKLVSRLKEEYDAVLACRAQASARLKEENRTLRARVSVLESERGDVSSALVHAVSEGERIRREGRTEVENDRQAAVAPCGKMPPALRTAAEKIPR